MKRSEFIKNHPPFFKPIRIAEHVWIGAQASILAGVTIGDGAVEGPKCVVLRAVESYAIVAGVPTEQKGVRN